MARTDMARYIGVIPNFLTVFKELRNMVRNDTNVLKLQDNMIPMKNRPGAPLEVESAGVEYRFKSIEEGITKGIYGRLLASITAVIDCLVRTYKSIREKYGTPMHMESVKGDFDQYIKGNVLDSSMVTTPISSLGGIAHIDKDGPCILSGFGERGFSHGEDPMMLAWAGHVLHPELTNEDKMVPLASVPWTIELISRLEKLTGANMSSSIQPIITKTAEMAMLVNAMNLNVLACHNPWTSHAVQSMLFHPPSTEISLASMEVGFDLIRLFEDEGNRDYDGYLSTIHPTVNSKSIDTVTEAKTIAEAAALGSTVACIKPTDPGPAWVSPPLPLTRQWGIDTQTRALDFSYTVTPFLMSGDKQRVILSAGSESNLIALSKPTDFGTDSEMTRFNRWNVKYNNQKPEQYIPRMMASMISSLISTDDSPMAVILKEAASKNYLMLTRISNDEISFIPTPGYQCDMRGDVCKSENSRLSFWNKNKTSQKTLFRDAMGMKLKEKPSKSNDPIPIPTNLLSLVSFSPPEGKWEADTALERYQAGFFVAMNRYPVSPTAVMKFIPLASIWNYSEAFDAYWQMLAWRNKKESSNDLMRSYVPSLLLNPLRPFDSYMDYELGTYEGDDDSKPRTRELMPILANKGDPRGWTKGYPADTSDPSEWAPADTPAGGSDKKCSQILYPPTTTIDPFYSRTFELNKDEPIGFSNPSNAAVQAGHGAACMPLFAAGIRFIDQLGMMTQNELHIRLRKYEPARFDPSQPDRQQALVNILTQ
jgi:hypothetical protein